MVRVYPCLEAVSARHLSGGFAVIVPGGWFDQSRVFFHRKRTRARNRARKEHADLVMLPKVEKVKKKKA